VHASHNLDQLLYGTWLGDKCGAAESKRLPPARRRSMKAHASNGSGKQFHHDHVRRVPRVESTTIATRQVVSGGTDLVTLAVAHATLPDARTAEEHTLSDLEILAASADRRLVGRFVSLRNVQVGEVVAGRGFWIASDHEELFVF